MDNFADMEEIIMKQKYIRDFIMTLSQKIVLKFPNKISTCSCVIQTDYELVKRTIQPTGAGLFECPDG